MSLLFDISPEEVPDKKAKKKSPQKKAAEPASAPAQPALEIPACGILGRSDGEYTCDCGSTYFDIIDDYRGEWLAECAFCGIKIRVPAIRQIVEDKPGFVFLNGRYSGMALAQVSETEQGVAYIRWCAEKHKSSAVKEACKSWVASVGYSATQR
jgi:hypothetical protein